MTSKKIDEKKDNNTEVIINLLHIMTSPNFYLCLKTVTRVVFHSKYRRKEPRSTPDGDELVVLYRLYHNTVKSPGPEFSDRRRTKTEKFIYKNL